MKNPHKDYEVFRATCAHPKATNRYLVEASDTNHARIIGKGKFLAAFGFNPVSVAANPIRYYGKRK